MLKLLRKKGVAKKVIWVVAILIIISFGFLGTAYLITDQAVGQYAGKLYGKKVDIEDYNKIYRHVNIQALMRFGDNYQNVRQYLNLDSETWDRLILLKEAKKRKIFAEDAEVVENIEQYAFFQRDNQFDSLLYNDIIKFVFKTTAREFEESVRDSIRLAKLYNEVTTNIAADENEIIEEYRRQNEKVQISYVYLPNESFIPSVTTSDEELQTYYDDNQIEFLLPPTINIEYVKWNFPEEETNDEPQAPSETSETETSKDQDLLENAKDLVRDQAAEMYIALKSEQTFAASADSFGLNRQSTGFFSKEQPDLSIGWSFEDINTLFDLDVGEFTDPIETKDGIIIAVLKEQKESHVPAFEEIQETVQTTLKSKKARQLSKEKSSEHVLTIKEAYAADKIKDFAKIAKNLGFELKQTPIFGRGQYLPTIGISKEFQEAAFTLTEEENISGAVETVNGYCILHLDSNVPADMDHFETKRQEIADGLLAESRNKAISEFLSQLRLKANVVDYISKLREQQNQ